MALGLVWVGAGRHAEEPGLRVDGVEAAVGAELHPADVVADRLDLPSVERGDEHGQVGLAARRGEGAGDVTGLAFRGGQLEDQHVLGQPAVVAGHDRGDAQGEALLAQQGVAAVAGAVDKISRVSGKWTMYLFSALQGHGDVLLARLERRADRVQARHELAVVAQHVEGAAAHAGHDAHATPPRRANR